MNFECNICSSNEPKSLTIINCNHLFHTECIKRWLDRIEQYPICRTKYSQKSNIKIKTEYELLESKCKKLKEEQSIIEKMSNEELLKQKAKEKVANNHIKYIDSFKQDPDNIKYVRFKDQTVLMVRKVLEGSLMKYVIYI